MTAVFVPVPILPCNLSNFISMAIICQRKIRTGCGKLDCSNAPYHISCSITRHITLKGGNPTLPSMAWAFRRILAFPPPRGVVLAKRVLPEGAGAKEDAGVHSTWTWPRRRPRKKTRSMSQKALMMRSGVQLMRPDIHVMTRLSRRRIASYSPWLRFLPRVLWVWISREALSALTYSELLRGRVL